jgi:general secretion pathway protein A
MYESFYKLKQTPFLLTPDPGFFFNSKTHRKALAYLLYGLEQQEGFIVITGDVGTGKTTLVSYLLNQIDIRNFVIAKIENTSLQALDLLRMICAEFGLPYTESGKAQLILTLEQFFREQVTAGKRVLLIVDEAQNLPEKSLEELRMLSNLQWQGRPLLQCYLLGQNQLREILRSGDLKQLRQRIIASHVLNPLDLDETRDYIKHRLNVAGWYNDPKIDGKVIRGIYDYSRGIPRIINLLCSRMMLYGQLEQLHHIDYPAFEQVLEDIKDEYWNEADADNNRPGKPAVMSTIPNA